MQIHGKTFGGKKSHQFPTSQRPRYLQITVQVTEYTKRMFFYITESFHNL